MSPDRRRKRLTERKADRDCDRPPTGRTTTQHGTGPSYTERARRGARMLRDGRI